MCGLVQDFFIDKAGRALVRSELIDFINDHLIDVEDEGFDVKTGNGLFILPNPNDINISKYVPEYSGNIDYSGFPEIKEEEKMPKVCLDYGHGASTAGKRSPDGTLLEYEFNRDVGRRIKAILERHNVAVIETVEDDTDLALVSRCGVANFYDCDYFVSIHANADKETWTSANGWGIYILSKGGKAEELAKKIQKHSKELGLKDRGIKTANFTVLTDTEMPAVLIEHGFYTNKEECEKLKSDIFRQKCAECDAKGILEQLGIEYKGKDTNVATKNEVADTNVGELVFTIGKKTYTANGVTKELEIAPEIENGRTKIPIAPLRDIGLTVEWDGAKQTVTVRG
jgi:N-acetylmuramoyl-L-alanine amidase